MENLDELIITKRENLFMKKETYLKMWSKHIAKECQCKKKNKICCKIPIKINLQQKNLGELYDSGILETLYNINQSITQSLRTQTGFALESIIEELLIEYNINYVSQYKIGNHKVDFLIYTFPDEKDIILSCKTTLRERHLQDKYLSEKYDLYTITMEKSDIKNTIYIDPKTKKFDSWFKTILVQYNKMPLNVLDLFCGCGGMTNGFQKAGFNVIAGIDIWDKAIATYETNYEHIALCKDLTTYPPEQFNEDYNITDIDVIIGGPPCQSFSIAGKRDKDDPRSSLFMEFKKYIDYYQPKAFIMENVIGILSAKNKKGKKCIDIIERKLSKNYNTIITKLYASDFGVPQNRRRVIIYGIRKDLNIMPTEPPLLINCKDDRVPVSTVLESRVNVDKKYFLSQKAIDGINRKKDRMKKEGKGFGAQFLDPNKPSYTIPARYWKDGYDALVYYSDTEIRRLTPSELAKIQSFPDDYEFIGSKKDVIMQIGNAVACKFAYYVALHLKGLLKFGFDLEKASLSQLTAYCKERKIRGYSKKNKADIIELIKFKY